MNTTEQQFTTEQLTSRSFVDENLKTMVKKTDEDGDISLYCYIQCGDDDTDIIKNSRGLVYKGDTLAVRAYSYTSDYNADDDVDKISELLMSHNPSECSIYDSYEGTLIRVFYLNDKWFVSTHKKLDAYKSKWCSNISFGDMFENALKSEYECNEKFKNGIDAGNGILSGFLDTLDKSLCYTYLVLNGDDNRIVCNPPTRPTTYFVGCFSADSKRPDMVNSLVPEPPRKQFDCIDDIIGYVRRTDYKTQQGVIVITPSTQFKILSKDYSYLFDIRGNEASVKFRYLQLRMDKERREALVFLYPNQSQTFDLYENTLYKIAKHLKNEYINRYAHKNITMIPQSSYRIIKQCHQWHCEDRESNKISIEYVINIMNELKPAILNKMIREFLQEDVKNEK
jgi:hypothetical protein